MANIIKRSSISIKGISKIKTNVTEIGDEIHASRTNNGWIILNYRTGKYYQCTSDFLRNYIIMLEQK